MGCRPPAFAFDTLKSDQTDAECDRSIHADPYHVEGSGR